MTPSTSPTRYGTLPIALHWFMAALLVAVYLCMELSGNFPKGSATRDALRQWHYMLGLSVFVLAGLRLVVNLLAGTPAISPVPPLWQTRLAQGVKLALYLLMMTMPLAGWLILSARGQAIPFFGLQLPALMAENRDAAGWIKEIHEAGATAGYFLVGLHAAAALFHHYFLRDDTLRRMLPGRG